MVPITIPVVTDHNVSPIQWNEDDKLTGEAQVQFNMEFQPHVLVILDGLHAGYMCICRTRGARQTGQSHTVLARHSLCFFRTYPGLRQNVTEDVIQWHIIYLSDSKKPSGSLRRKLFAMNMHTHPSADVIPCMRMLPAWDQHENLHCSNLRPRR